MKYRHLFFDLDHTLWDFEKNANETLRTLYAQHDFARFGTFGVEEFIRVYSDINHALWRLYQSNKITQRQLRDARFVRALTRLGVPEAEIPATISAEFTSILPRKSAVFPYTHEVLGYLKPNYRLHLITNGFNDVQSIKLHSSNLRPYFEEIITSEESGCLKPDPRMFAHALARTGATAAESLMIGDNLECDVLGAHNVGIDQVYFNPDRRRHFNTNYPRNKLPERAEGVSIVCAGPSATAGGKNGYIYAVFSGSLPLALPLRFSNTNHVKCPLSGRLAFRTALLPD